MVEAHGDGGVGEEAEPFTRNDGTKERKREGRNKDEKKGLSLSLIRRMKFEEGKIQLITIRL